MWCRVPWCVWLSANGQTHLALASRPSLRFQSLTSFWKLPRLHGDMETQASRQQVRRVARQTYVADIGQSIGLHCECFLRPQGGQTQTRCFPVAWPICASVSMECYYRWDVAKATGCDCHADRVHTDHQRSRPRAFGSLQRRRTQYLFLGRREVALNLRGTWGKPFKSYLYLEDHPS